MSLSQIEAAGLEAWLAACARTSYRRHYSLIPVRRMTIPKPGGGETRLRRSLNLSVTPRRPACPRRALGWSSLTTPWASRVAHAFLCTCSAAPTPGAALGLLFAHSPSRISLPGKACASSFFEACSAFTHVAACTLARSRIRDPSAISLPP